MKLSQEYTIEELARLKSFEGLTPEELSFIVINYSEEEFKQLHSFFNEVNIHFENNCLAIPSDVEEAIFKSFNYSQKEKKNVILKAIVGVAAAAILLFCFNWFSKSDKTINEVSNTEFMAYTMEEEYGLYEQELDEVSLILQTMKFNQKTSLNSKPSCDW